MKYMAVVECISSGRLYINDIISHGYRPLVINSKGADDYRKHYREMIMKGIGDRADYIDEDDDFDTFIEKLKKLIDDKTATKEDKENYRLLSKQRKAMGAYRAVLEERVAKANVQHA